MSSPHAPPNWGTTDIHTGEEEMDGDDLEAADSGIGVSLRPSSGRLSSLSHYSDGTIIQIPDGRYMHVLTRHMMWVV